MGKYLNLWSHRCLFLLLFLIPSAASAGGLIVNEASNGPSGAKEFIELMVVGSQASPLGTVNLNNWIIDDNNGEWGGGGTGVGTAPGYLRISASACPQFLTVNPGKIIVAYNAADPNSALPADDENDANNDGVYILSTNSSCLVNCPGPPDSSNSGYSSCSVPGNTTWSSVALRNGGDVAQSRDASGIYFHGFSYGDVGAPFPSGSFNVDTSSGTGSTYVFSCGNWTASSNFAKQSSATDSPGATNNAANAVFRQKISNGSFDYANPASAGNCNALPLVAISKSSIVIADGISAANFKSIPGGQVVYTINVVNSGPGTADNNSLMLVDIFPANMGLFVGNYFAGSPVRFVDGAISSGLNFTFTSLASSSDDIDFSNNNGATFAYTPVPDALGYDSTVTHIRFSPKGSLNASSGGGNPSFAFELKAIVQ